MGKKEAKGIEFINAKIKSGNIIPEIPVSEVFSKVTDESVVILKNLFDPDLLISLRNDIHQWGLETESSNPENPTETWHRIDHNPAKSATQHIFHSYYFVECDNGFAFNQKGQEMRLNEKFWPFFKSLGSFQSQLAGVFMDYKTNKDGFSLNPQIIHYPSGGGYFDEHLHQLVPQKVGLIVSMSQQGEDFFKGGTCFKLGDELISIENHLHIGDMAIFKYDIPHSVSIVDEEEVLDFQSERGRWTMVIPFLKK